MNFNYKIIKHIENDEDEVLIETSATEALFTNMAPIGLASHVLTLYNRIIPNTELDEYNGTFSIYTRHLPTENTQEILNQLFQILLDCEDKQAIISIQVQAVEAINQNPNIDEFTTILDHATINLVTKTFRAEITEPVINMISMVYKNSK